MFVGFLSPRKSVVVSFYLDNVFIITVIIMTMFISILVLGAWALSRSESLFEERPDIENTLITLSVILLVAGFVLPLIIAILLKIYPSLITDIQPYAIYIIGIFVVELIYINFKRFKLLGTKSLVQNEVEGDRAKIERRVADIDEKVFKYRFDMLTRVILILYIAILL